MSADLHLHTHYSDGNWSPQELVDAAIRLGFECVAVTDHDTVAALDEARERAGEKIRLIDGIEMNTIWINPDGHAQDVHILGYFIDPANIELQKAMDEQQHARLKYLEDTLELLRQKGHELKIDDVKAAAAKGSIGRPHICIAMLKAGIFNDVSRAYAMLLNRDSEFRVVRESITPQRAIKAIRAAGGICSLAHPGKDAFIPELVEELRSCGLNAIEAFHRGHSLAQVKKYMKLARSMNLLVTGGSDCHGPFENYPVSLGTIRFPMDLFRRLESAHATLESS